MKWWAIPIAVVFGLIIALVWRRNPIKQIANELRAIDQASVVKREMIERGAVVARAQVEARHAEKIRQFNENQKIKAVKLHADPVALSKWLDRLSD